MTEITYIVTEVSLNNNALVAIPAASCQSVARIQNCSTGTDVVYFTEDGTTPSAAHGSMLTAGQGFEWERHELPQAAVRVFSAGTPRVAVAYA